MTRNNNSEILVIFLHILVVFDLTEAQIGAKNSWLRLKIAPNWYEKFAICDEIYITAVHDMFIHEIHEITMNDRYVKIMKHEITMNLKIMKFMKNEMNFFMKMNFISFIMESLLSWPIF